jgi:hypothetical protein
LNEGKDLMIDYLGDDYDNKRRKKFELAGCPDEFRGLSYNKLLEIVESLLSFHAWVKETDSFDVTPEGMKQMRRSVCVMLKTLKEFIPRLDGNGWKLQKFHEHLHVVDDISRFGSPRNTDAGSGERSLKYFAKRPAETSQKRTSVFLGQVCSRLHETAMIRFANRTTGQLSLNNDDNADDNSDAANDDVPEQVKSIFPERQSRYSVNFRLPGTVNGIVRWITRETKDQLRQVSMAITDWFRKDRQERKYDMSVVCYTEYIRDNQYFRAHPNYRSTGEWYDWVAVRFDSSSSNKDSTIHQPPLPNDDDLDHKDYYPSKILCFFEDPIEKNKCALVQSCEAANHSKNKHLTQEWFLEFRRTSQSRVVPVLRRVPVDAFGSIMFVVQEVPGILYDVAVPKNSNYKRCLVVRNRQRVWPRMFCKNTC